MDERPWHRSWPVNLPREVDVEPAPLYSLLEASARRSPKATFLAFQGNRLSFSTVLQASERFASALLSTGLAKGDRVALFMPNMPQFVMCYFGTLMAGGVVVPCSPLYKERELETQLKDSGAKTVVAASDRVGENDLFASLEGCRGRLGLEHVITASLTDYLPSYKKPLARFARVENVRRSGSVRFTELIRESGPLRTPVTASAEDAAAIQYTGGTTGVCKGALLTHGNLMWATSMAQACISLTEKDVTLAVLPLFHIFGMVACLTLPTMAGAQTVLLPRFDVLEVMKTIQKSRVTFFPGVPTMYVAINNHPQAARFELGTVRVAFSGGAPLPSAVRKRFNQLTGGNLFEGYGLTESAAVAITNPIEGGRDKEASIGIPFPSTDAKIVSLDDPQTALGVGVPGELAIRGRQVMKGYWQDEEGTRLVIRDGWLLTGDIAKMDEDGYFYIVDRKKDMINVGGQKVYPREVEEVLFEHPAVKEAAVVGIPDAYMGETVKAFVVLKDPAKGEGMKEELTSYCRDRLAKYKVPHAMDFVGELPKTLVGKVYRRKLREGGSTSV